MASKNNIHTVLEEQILEIVHHDLSAVESVAAFLKLKFPESRHVWQPCTQVPHYVTLHHCCAKFLYPPADLLDVTCKGGEREKEIHTYTCIYIYAYRYTFICIYIYIYMYIYVYIWQRPDPYSRNTLLQSGRPEKRTHHFRNPASSDFRDF